MFLHYQTLQTLLDDAQTGWLLLENDSSEKTILSNLFLQHGKIHKHNFMFNWSSQ